MTSPDQGSTETDQSASGATSETSPPWGDDFDAAKAWALVENLRKDKEKLAGRPALSKEDKDKLAEYDRLVEAGKTELEQAQEKAKAAEDRIAAYRDRALSAEVRAAASAFIDPGDALAFLDKSALVTDAGDVNSDAIKSALEDLGNAKPHLLRPTQPPGMQPNPAQGRSGNGAPSGPRSEAAAAESAKDWRKAGLAKADQLLELRKGI